MKASVLSLVILVTVCALGAKIPHSKTGVIRGNLELDEGRIINGKPASKGQFPWQVGVFFDLPSGRRFCGGSLISSRWVLTAGHCAKNATNFVINLGSITTDNEELGRVTVYTNKSIVHENYDNRYLNNDVALIDLGVDIGSNDYIKPIHLPSKGEVVGVNEQLEVSGWGITNDSGTVVNRDLNFVKLYSISNEECLNSFSPRFVIESTLCAVGNTTESPCSGDSGGGLVKRQNGKSIHVGITSFVNDAGCSLGIPTGYSRTESYLDWISKHTGIKV